MTKLTISLIVLYVQVKKGWGGSIIYDEYAQLAVSRIACGGCYVESLTPLYKAFTSSILIGLEDEIMEITMSQQELFIGKENAEAWHNNYYVQKRNIWYEYNMIIAVWKASNSKLR